MDKVKSKLMNQINETAYRLWIDGLCGTITSDNQFLISGRNDFITKVVAMQYDDLIRTALKETPGYLPGVKYSFSFEVNYD